MQNSADTVTDLDLTGYVDGQLDDWHSARVETFLADHPAEAARVLHDIRLQRELRIALSLPGSAASLRAKDRLARVLRRDAVIGRAMRVAPVAMVAAFGALIWAGIVPLGVQRVSASVSPPEFVTAALAARDASDIRLPMQSMAEDPHLDTDELRAMTGILLPTFDPEWQVIDAQVFPSPQGPGVEIVFETPDLGRVNHFAVRPGGFAVSLPEAALSGTSPISWFQIGETAYVLISDRGDPDDLATAAERLTGSLY